MLRAADFDGYRHEARASGDPLVSGVKSHLVRMSLRRHVGDVLARGGAM
jgi:hypothetical protein